MKRSGRWEHLKDYKRTADGTYVYTGEHYTPSGDAGRQKTTLCLLTAGILAVSVASGCLNAEGMLNTFYVILPYIGEMSAVFALCWNTVRLLAGGRQLKAHVFHAISKHLPAAALLTAVFAAAGIAAYLVFMFLNGFTPQLLQSVLYLVAKAGTLTLGLCTRRYFTALEWKQAT